jgi:tetratricopeptide (TPR) repeat protein
MPEIATLIADARAAALEHRFDEAAQVAQRVLGALPSCLIALRTLAWSQLELGDERALETFVQCAAFDPEDALAYVGQAIWYQQRHQAQAATERWTRAWELDPHNQEIRRALVKLTGELPESPLAEAIGLLRSGREDEAAELLRRLRQTQPRRDVLVDLALLEASSALGLQREAFELAREVFAAAPQCVKAALYMAAVEDRAGRTLRSREAIARAEQVDPGLTVFADTVRQVGLQPALDLHRASRTPIAAGR